MRADRTDFREPPKINAKLSTIIAAAAIILAMGAFVGVFAAGIILFPYVPPPEPTPTPAPIMVITASTTPTPLPPGTALRYYVGQWGPQSVLTYTLTPDTPVAYDPTIGERDDNAMLAYGYEGNHHIIPAALADGRALTIGYYDADMGLFCYAYPLPDGTRVVPVNTDSITKARMNDTYGVGRIIIGPDGLIYAWDTENNLIRLKDGQPVRFEDVAQNPGNADDLFINWQKYIGWGTPPNSSNGYIINGSKS